MDRPRPSAVPLLSNDIQAASYNAYMWLRDDGTHCRVVHFHALDGLAYYTATAKHQGLLPPTQTIVVSSHAPSATRLHNLNLGSSPTATVLDEDVLTHEHMQRRSAELAVGKRLQPCARSMAWFVGLVYIVAASARRNHAAWMPC